MRRIRIDEPNEVMLSLGMSSCEQYFVLGTWPERGQHAMPKLRLFTRDGVCCSTLTIGRRLCDVHYMLVTAGAVHVGHRTNVSEKGEEGILRVPLEAGLSNAERKSLKGCFHGRSPARCVTRYEAGEVAERDGWGLVQTCIVVW